jgi:replicative DNA helicase
MHGIAQIILAKNRNGAKGDVNLRFVEECMKFL